MSENKPNPAPVKGSEAEPEDPRWYLQRMYDLAVEPLESGAPSEVK